MELNIVDEKTNDVRKLFEVATKQFLEYFNYQCFLIIETNLMIKVEYYFYPNCTHIILP
jgi:hypothetical protein